MSRFPIFWLLAFLFLCMACRGDGRKVAVSGADDLRLGEYFMFYNQVSDSLTSNPAWARRQVRDRMARSADSLEWYYYAGILLKTFFFTFDVDSVTDYYAKGRQFWQRQEDSPLMADLISEYDNIMGNLYSRLGRPDSAVPYFVKAYRWRLRGVRKENTPDILMNLADVLGRHGQFDRGAFWYRKALTVCDSLNLPDSKKLAVYYGLGQI